MNTESEWLVKLSPQIPTLTSTAIYTTTGPPQQIDFEGIRDVNPITEVLHYNRSFETNRSNSETESHYH